MMKAHAELDPAERRARARRLALALGLLALGFYAGFILLGIAGGRG
jgi:hypothetical protein